MNVLEQLSPYIGREQQKQLLREHAAQLASIEQCQVLYFEGEGGLGKTRLLDACPDILQSDLPDVPVEFVRIRIAQTIDLYSFESRSPEVIEKRLIAGLKQGDGHQWYRLSAGQVDFIFADYQQAYADYLREQVKWANGITANYHGAHRLRRVFIDCWNILTDMHPVIMSFDTIETILHSPAPDQALVNTADATTGADLVRGWLQAVLPHLKHTLVLLSGRPVQGDNAVVADLTALGLLTDLPQQLEPFNDADSICQYLAAYDLVVVDEDIDYLRTITRGRPLLLTCYAETRRSHWEDGSPGLPALENVETSAAFEQWLVETILNADHLPGVSPQQDLAMHTLVYSLYILTYARRGMHIAELSGLFEQMNVAYDLEVIRQLPRLALIKTIGDLLLLHDEIFLLIDAAGKPDASGLRQPTLNYLCELSHQRVINATDRASLLGAMSDHIYYELSRDGVTGYRLYAIYADRLLQERSINEVLVLSDAFWSTINYRVFQNSKERYPFREDLQRSGLTINAILRGDQIRRVRLLRARDQIIDAMNLAESLHQQFLAEGYTTADGSTMQSQYVLVDLNIARAITITLVRPEDYEQRVEQIYVDVLNLLEDPLRITNGFLQLRRNYYLGEAYMLRGFLRRQQQRFADAETDVARARAAFKAYCEHIIEYDGRTGTAESLLNDQITTELAQATNNMAYNLALRGDLQRARRLSNEIIERYINYASDYRRALFYNTNVMIHLRSDKFLEARARIGLAEQAARASGSSRAQGLVAHARGQLERMTMRASRHPDQTIETYYRESSELLNNEKSTLREIYYDWAGFRRDLAQLYETRGDASEAQRHRVAALDLLDKALLLLSQEPSMQRATLLEGKAHLLTQMRLYSQARTVLDQAEEMMHTPMSEYGQVVCGRIALQRALLALHHTNDPQQALHLMTVALARSYLFARRHPEHEAFENLIELAIRDISENVLHTFARRLENVTGAHVMTELAYQRPDEARWRIAWDESVQSMQEMISIRVDM